MAIDKLTSQALASGSVTSDAIAIGAITVADIPNGEITAAKLATTAISDKLGYTPVSPTILSDSLALKAPQATTYTKTEVDTLLTSKTNVNTLTASWTIQETGGVIYFKYNGVNKAKLDSSGNLTVVGNVTAYGTV